MYHIAPSHPQRHAKPPASQPTVPVAEYVKSSPSVKVEALARTAWDHQQAKRWPEALEHYRSAVSLLDLLDPRQHWQLLIPIKNNMASVLREQGKYREAEACYVQAINLMESGVHATSSELSSLYSNLAALYHAVGMSEAAMRMQQKCVELMESSRDTTPSALFAALKSLATLCHRSGETESAKKAAEKAEQVLA